jgi:hypothetical protein
MWENQWIGRSSSILMQSPTFFKHHACKKLTLPQITKLPNFSSLRASPSEGEKWVPIPKNCHHYLKQLKSAPTESPNGSQSPYFSRREKHTLFLLDIVLHFVTPKAKRVTTPTTARGSFSLTPLSEWSNPSWISDWS